MSGDRQLGANDGAQACFPCRPMKSRGTVDAIGVQQRHRWVVKRGSTLDQRFR